MALYHKKNKQHKYVSRPGQGAAFALGAAAAGAVFATLGIVAAKRLAKKNNAEEAPVQPQPIFRFAEEGESPDSEQNN